MEENRESYLASCMMGLRLTHKTELVGMCWCVLRVLFSKREYADKIGPCVCDETFTEVRILIEKRNIGS